MKILVVNQELKNCAKQLEARIAEYQELIVRLESLITRIDASWEGQACITYISIMRGYATKAAKMISVLTEYKNYIQQAAITFENKDTSAAARIRGAF